MTFSFIKSALVLSIVLNACVALAQSTSHFGSSGTASGEGISVSESSGNAVIYKKDLELVVNDAIDVLQGEEASEEFIAIKEKLIIIQQNDLSNEEAAVLIIRLATK